MAEKPTFREAWRNGQHCLVPATGIFEWKATPTGKQPYFIAHRDGEELLLAGLWQQDRLEGKGRITFTILVGPPNTLVAEIHDRQAVMLTDEGARAWMHPRLRPDGERMDILQTCPAEDLMAWPVSTEVNSPRADGPQLIEPLPEASREEYP